MSGSPTGRRARGLTFGRLLIIMAAAILLALLAAGYQNWQLRAYPTFDDIGFASLNAAAYDMTELTREQLEKLDRDTPRIPGALLFVRTSEHNFVKMAGQFGYRFFGSDLRFVIMQAMLFRPDGSPQTKQGNQYINLAAGYDFDSGQIVPADSPGVDVVFRQRGVADQSVLTVNETVMAIPTTEMLRRR